VVCSRSFYTRNRTNGLGATWRLFRPIYATIFDVFDVFDFFDFLDFLEARRHLVYGPGHPRPGATCWWGVGGPQTPSTRCQLLWVADAMVSDAPPPYTKQSAPAQTHTIRTFDSRQAQRKARSAADTRDARARLSQRHGHGPRLNPHGRKAQRWLSREIAAQRKRCPMAVGKQQARRMSLLAARLCGCMR
jgi:hypothetical protein